MKMKMKKWLINEIDHFIDKINILSKIISPSRYQCGKTSLEASEINADLYIYNKDNNKDNK